MPFRVYGIYLSILPWKGGFQILDHGGTYIHSNGTVFSIVFYAPNHQSIKATCAVR